MTTETKCDRHSDDQLKELIKLRPINTIGDTEARDVIHDNLGGEEVVEEMRQHIDHCLHCKERIEQLAMDTFEEQHEQQISRCHDMDEADLLKTG